MSKEKENDMNAIEQFKNEKLKESLERNEEAEELRSQFVSDFPINKIGSMSMNNYLLSVEGGGNQKSFCRQLAYGLAILASKGNTYPSIFGIYLKGVTELKLSSTFSNVYVNDFNAAFAEIKKEIVNLLHSAEKDDLQGIIKCKLNVSFVLRLLIVYFPEKFIPVCTEPAIKGYCESVGLQSHGQGKQIYDNIALRDWKNSVPEICDWSNFVFMDFCGWLRHSNKKVNGPAMRRDVTVAKAKEIDEEIDRLNLVGETREAVINVRVNQGEFRNRLLHRYSRCCLCGVDNPELLVASHIKPWAESEPEEKLDVDNGFLMCPNHDRLFDKGWISFDDEGSIEISDQLTKENQIFTNVSADMKIDLTDGNKKYLKYHRDNVFLGKEK
jgi:hypothetical protein